MKDQTINTRFVLLAGETLGLIVSCLCLAYISLRLKLNQVILTALKTMAIQKMIASLLQISLQILHIFDLMEPSKISCFLGLGVLQLNVVGPLILTSFISFARYYIAFKASRTQMVTYKRLIIFMILWLFLNHGISYTRFSLATWIMELNPLYNLCLGHDPPKRNVLPWMVLSLHRLLLASIGLGKDNFNVSLILSYHGTLWQLFLHPFVSPFKKAYNRLDIGVVFGIRI